MLLSRAVTRYANLPQATFWDQMARRAVFSGGVERLRRAAQRIAFGALREMRTTLLAHVRVIFMTSRLLET